MKTYKINFTKTIYGFAEIEAENKKEAKEKFLNGEYDEFEKESYYVFEEKDKKPNFYF